MIKVHEAKLLLKKLSLAHCLIAKTMQEHFNFQALFLEHYKCHIEFFNSKVEVVQIPMFLKVAHCGSTE